MLPGPASAPSILTTTGSRLPFHADFIRLSGPDAKQNRLQGPRPRTKGCDVNKPSAVRHAQSYLKRLQALRGDLIEDRKRILADLEETRLHQLEENDEEGAESERSLGFGAAEHVARRLREVDAAIERIRDGSFGQCVDCGAPISASRLTANPLALRCLPCQSAYEQQR